MKLKFIEIPEISHDLGLKQAADGILVFNSEHDESRRVHGRPFRSSHFSVIYIFEGSLQFKVNLSAYQLQAGEMMIIHPSAIRELLQGSPHLRFGGLFFTPEYLFKSGFYKKHIELFHFFGSEFEPHLQAAPAASEKMRHLFTLLLQLVPDTDNTIIDLIFQATILQLGMTYNETHSQQAEMVPSNRKDNLVYRFLQLLPMHFREEHEVGFYAGKLFVNAKYLTQALKEKTGKTARDFITEMIILDARVMLDNPALSVSQVAESLGFSDQFHFSHFFKKHTGHTPSRYRTAQ
ncbi:AraC family transcriptional regulator [Chitinophaga sancti]|uniref:AraC-type DNA-binding protein n=1 Tax=Chitinophaga sancti TaxID=1004 RepID=A0A1K1SV58_9BACT|nr:helix-turn-helix domain-containing protein [Chitinophaga sancti]WQD63811.1 helix-turn-helix domain-containing protein [Chitinophaga sancti]WQG90564.1 helix-turn-helix domain-containing protein [Chitinophaga sancti]SFW88195.1 AraC-type DNA-binding protein [Chitinophaga sancti]